MEGILNTSKQGMEFRFRHSVIIYFIVGDDHLWYTSNSFMSLKHFFLPIHPIIIYKRLLLLVIQKSIVLIQN